MVGQDPTLAHLINPKTLEKILSPEVLHKVQDGTLDEATLQEILEIPTTTSEKTSTVGSGSSEGLLPQMLSNTAPAIYLEGGLMIKEVKHGDGRHFPQDGDKLLVDYVGYLPNGEVSLVTKKTRFLNKLGDF